MGQMAMMTRAFIALVEHEVLMDAQEWIGIGDKGNEDVMYINGVVDMAAKLIEKLGEDDGE